MKCELPETILTTKHGILVDCTAQKDYFVTTDLSEGHQGHLLSYTEDLFSYHNSWAFAIAELYNILSWWCRSKYMYM